VEQCGITIQSADPVPLFTVVISGLFTSGASFSLAHEYSHFTEKPEWCYIDTNFFAYLLLFTF